MLGTVYVLDGLLFVQILLGVATVITQKGEIIATLHVAAGAGLLGFATLLALRAWPSSPRESGPNDRPASAAEELRLST